MPPARVDPDRRRSLGAALGSLRECARDGADEVLAQFPELGDELTQGVLDAWVDQLADLLREVDATATELAGRLDVASVVAAYQGRESGAAARSALPAGSSLDPRGLLDRGRS